MQFRVSGKPFFPLGGQAHNSSAYNAEEIASAIAGVCALGGNFLEAPIYWEQIEPVEGGFDFSSVDVLLEACREAGLRLGISWFGTWKNGEMRYVPEWVKGDKDRFPRVIGYDGREMEVLSSYAEATRVADKAAFTSLCRHLATVDTEEQTVIVVQVENEPGILGSDRDYGEAAGEAVLEGVPPELLDYLSEWGSGAVYDTWQATGGMRGGDWLQTFGFAGYEYREAWSIARFIDSVAEAGRAVLNRPMYTNAWLGGDGWPVPGFYPAAGPTADLLGIWKCAAPNLDLIAPDIYIRNPMRYDRACAAYRSFGNVLFIPESSADDSNAINMVHAIAEHRAVGFACFAVDSVLDLEGNLRDDALLFAASFQATRAILPLIMRHREAGRVHGVVHELGSMFAPFHFERFIGMMPFVDLGLLTGVTDHRHARAGLPADRPRFGYIVEASPYEFYLAGSFHLHMVPNRPPGWVAAMRFPTVSTPPDFLSVEEGTLDDDGVFVPHRKRNGDEVVFGGFWVEPDVGVVRVRLTPQEPDLTEPGA